MKHYLRAVGSSRRRISCYRGLVVRSLGSHRTFFSGLVLAVLIGLANLALIGLSCSHIFPFSSRLPDAELAPAVGATAPDFTLVDQHGEAVALSSLRGRQTVLVFYRGFW